MSVDERQLDLGNRSLECCQLKCEVDDVKLMERSTSILGMCTGQDQPADGCMTAAGRPTASAEAVVRARKSDCFKNFQCICDCVLFLPKQM